MVLAKVILVYGGDSVIFGLNVPAKGKYPEKAVTACEIFYAENSTLNRNHETSWAMTEIFLVSST